MSTMQKSWLLPIFAGYLIAPSLAAGQPVTLAYYESNSYSALQRERASLRQIAADLYGIDARGNIAGTLPNRVAKLAAASHIQVFATVSNFGPHGFSKSIAHAVLTDAAIQNHALVAMSALISDKSLAGINIDFENVSKADRRAYSGFIGRLSVMIHAAGSLLVVSVPAALSNDPHDDWTGAYDYAAIGQACDIFQLMTYDENGPWGAPGPVAGIDWVTASLTYTLSAVSPHKISLGMAAYGYDWNTTKNTGVQIAAAGIPGLISRTGATIHWDGKVQSPWLSYSAGGASHIVWYEDGRSAKIKAALAAQHGLASVSVYALGLDDPAYWHAIIAGFAR